MTLRIDIKNNAASTRSDGITKVKRSVASAPDAEDNGAELSICYSMRYLRQQINTSNKESKKKSKITNIIPIGGTIVLKQKIPMDSKAKKCAAR